MTQEAKIIIGISVVSLLLLIGGAFLFSGKEQTTNTDKPIDTALLAGNKRLQKGEDTAKVTIVEFADFQCPACARTQPVINQLFAEYKKDVTFIYRHFPLPQHKNAILAAKAAEAAGEQGKFFEMADLLYSQQDRWSENSKAKDVFIDLASDLGIDTKRFENDLENNDYEKIIQADKSDGLKFGVNSTPTFFVNGQRMYDNSYDSLKEAIISQL